MAVCVFTTSKRQQITIPNDVSIENHPRIKFTLAHKNLRWKTSTWKKNKVPFDRQFFKVRSLSQKQTELHVSKNSGFSPQVIHFKRVFHYFHHPFWGFSPYFWKHLIERWKITSREESESHRLVVFVLVLRTRKKWPKASRGVKSLK